MCPPPLPGLQVTSLCSVHCHTGGFMCGFLQSLDCPPTHSRHSAQLVTSIPQAAPHTAIPIQPQRDSHCPGLTSCAPLPAPAQQPHRGGDFSGAEAHSLSWLDPGSLQCPSQGSRLQVGPLHEPRWLPTGPLQGGSPAKGCSDRCCERSSLSPIDTLASTEVDMPQEFASSTPRVLKTG